ncbi:hypothetical protein TNCV_2597461 [Trichonephila clavipes]|nr:hypothetical protein TNCV_2597461 [Trichonephila clavipes]
MTRRKGLRPDEITNSLRELFENESDDCEESKESAGEINKISVTPDIYVTIDVAEWISRINNFPDRFVTRNGLRQFCGPTSIAKHTNVIICDMKDHILYDNCMK